MTIASEITNYANGLGDAYDAVNDMGGVIPQDKNMNNLDTAIRTIPQTPGGSGATYFYTDSPYFNVEQGGSFYFYKDAALTTIATNADFMNAITGGGLYLSLAGEPEVWAVGFAEVPEGSTWDPTEELWFEIRSGDYYYVYKCDSSNYCVCEFIRRFQRKLTAGSNISINGATNTISATDTTYSAFTGATSSVAGSAGLVPAPTTSDPDKFLKGDGTWGTVSGSTTTFYSVKTSGVTRFYSDQAGTQLVTGQNIADAFASGAVYFSIGLGDLLPVISCLPQGQPGLYFFAVTNSNMMISYGATSTTEFIEDDYTIQEKLTAGSNISISGDTISATDTTYSDFTGASSSTAGANGLVPAPAAGDQEKVLHGDGTWKDTTAKLVEMSYGEANAWTKFINAYNAGSIVYCRASSNANPASGSQTRKAFMAYVNNAANPTSVEFQYVRSVSSKTEAQPVDQVFVYTLTNTNGGTWSVASRNMGPKIAAGAGISVSYSNGTYTISLA